MAVVDLGGIRDEADFLKASLKRMGLEPDIAKAIAQMGRLVRDHKHFERLLTEVDGEIRQELYESLRPHLKFEAKPLDWYVSQAGQRAEREQWPTLGENGHLQAFKPAADVSSTIKDAENAIARSLAERTLTLVCGKCTRTGIFYAVGEETNVDVILKARRDGWIYDFKHEPPREICPECPTALRTPSNG